MGKQIGLGNRLSNLTFADLAFHFKEKAKLQIKDERINWVLYCHCNVKPFL